MSNIEDSLLVDLEHKGDFSNNEKGDLKTIQGIDNLRQAIYNRLVTSKGTIIHRPDYGVGAKSYQGAISSLEKQRELALGIREQLLEDTRIESVDSVRFTPDEDSRTGTFIINVKITVAGLGQLDEAFSPFDKE